MQRQRAVSAAMLRRLGIRPSYENKHGRLHGVPGE
jgi:hypothetical protein